MERPIPMQLLNVIVLIPFLYFISFIFLSSGSVSNFCSRIGGKNQSVLHIHRDNNIDEDLQDRIVNPDMYQPLLAATNNGEGN